MLRRPNDTYSWRGEKEVQKKNQMGRKFERVFNILLNPNYYEGTLQGRYFHETNANGRSRIYVKDHYEKEIHDMYNRESNEIRYLVGFTGMGKTTLLRNTFCILDRNIHIRNDGLIIYISFYYLSLSEDQPYKIIETQVIEHIVQALKVVMQRYSNLFTKDESFWNGFYAFIEENKPVLLKKEELDPDILLSDFFESSEHKTFEQKMQSLKRTCEENKLEYYSCLLKYVLHLIDEINKIVFIFDDIESKEALFHRPVVEIARHLHSCFSCMEDRKSWVKTIVSLRAYTFRSNVDRQLEARRERIEKNTILKLDCVDLHDIFNIRFDEIERIEKSKENAGNLESYKEARRQLNRVESQIYSSFGNMIYKLANCNLCNAMIIYNSILVNVEWIAQNEMEHSGGFRIDADNYKLTAKTIFYTLAFGNDLSYSDERNDLFPNILHNKEEGGELINLYIIRYLKRIGATDLYGQVYQQGESIIREITRIFVKNSDASFIIENWQSKIRESLSYLYNSKMLLRSIYDIESIDDNQIERQYVEDYKLYLSPSVQLLYEMFSQNALLLELYRDTIYTDIEKNDVLTIKMETGDIMLYLIRYIEKLFEYEKENIGKALQNLELYIENFGEEFLVSPLLEGVLRNLKSYYPDVGKDCQSMNNKINKIIQSLITYSKNIEEEWGVKFRISDFLLKNVVENEK